MEAIQFEKTGSLVHITLNRPKVGNAINDVLIEDLFRAMIDCDENPDIRAVLLSGAGKTFCVGGDLNYFAEYAPVLPQQIKRVVVQLHGAISRMTRMDAPVVAAVHGNIAGAGLSLLSAADIVLAAESATFTMAYTSVGLSPDGSSTYFLPRLVGLKRALELALTNRKLSAQEALEWGIVSRVVPDDKLLDEGHQLALELSNGPTKALGAAKRLIRDGWEKSLETQMEHEAQAIAAMTKTEDFIEGVSAFLGKRPPKYEGK